MNKNFSVGYSQMNITPPLGIGIAGYYVPRYAKGVLSDLYVKTVALSLNEKTVLVICVDVCYIETHLSIKYRKAVAKATGVPFENIFLSVTHTHTGGLVTPTAMFNADEILINKYAEFVGQRLADCAILAIKDLEPAKMGYITGQAPERVAYIRRYKMKDGSIMTCPPIGDANIDHPIGELDQRVNVLRFDREGCESILLVNYGLHVDNIGGELLSSDWPGVMSDVIEKTLDAKCIFISGAQGDVGSTNIHPSGGDMNDTEISFDNEMKSPGMSRFVGRALAGTILQVFDKVHYIPVDKLDIVSRNMKLAANVPEKKHMPLAHKYKELHDAGRDDEIPFEAMELSTVVAEVVRMCELENGPEHFVLPLTGLRIGNVALIGIPGQPFTEVGVEIKKAEGWELILPCVMTNGRGGYFPMKSAFDEGGYEARSSRYKSGVAEHIIAEAKQLLEEMKV